MGLITVIRLILAVNFSLIFWSLDDRGNRESPIISFPRQRYQRIIYSKEKMLVLTLVLNNVGMLTFVNDPLEVFRFSIDRVVQMAVSK